jgi:predicted nucleotidyltransferase
MTQNIFEITPEIINILIQKESHGREIAVKLNVAQSSVQRTLSKLQKEGVIYYKTIGKNKIYKLKKNIITKRYIIDTEFYKLNKLLKKELLLRPIVEKLSKINTDIVLIFGSYSKGTYTKKSDIDIFIETKDKNFKKTAEEINTRINAKIGLINIDDILIKEIIKNHIIIKGAEKYYERIKFFEED